MASNNVGNAGLGTTPIRGGFSSFPAGAQVRSKLNDSEHLVGSTNSSRRPSQASALNSSKSASVTSKQSSSSIYQSAIMHQPSNKSQAEATRRAQSQYPSHVENNHVEFILVAAFDIDRGSIMEHQYPGPISGDETMLAELMLPEQAHVRLTDWTMFFLHKDLDSPMDDSASQSNNSSIDLHTNNSNDRSSTGTAEDAEEIEDVLENSPLIYVLNHVNTKHDKTVKRGAIVKAMAICTRHSFVDIFKPVLVLAIEEYFNSPTLDTLAMLYDSLNAMDLSLMPKLSLLERHILQASSAKDLFVEKFERMISQQKEDDDDSGVADRLASGENTPQSAGFRQALPRDTHEYESRIKFNNHSVPVKIPTAKSAETVGSFSIIKLIQTFSGPHQSAPQPFAIHPHLTTGGAYTHPIIVLVNALLTQKRVIFLGHNRPSEEVSELVLAACSLVSGGVLRGFTRHAFPYTDLSKSDDLQKVPGFIAGVTNPIFAANPKWWDLLCDLPSGRMKISNMIEQPHPTDGWVAFQQQNPAMMVSSPAGQTQDYTGDVQFMESVQRAVTNRLGEGVVRQMWRDWITKLTRIAAAFEEMIYGTSALYIGGDRADAGDYGLSGHGYVWSDDSSKQRELAGNVSRIEGWRQTRSYYSYKQDLIHMYDALPIKTLDLAHHHDRLRTQKLSNADSAAIYLGVSAAVNTPQEICQLLVVSSEAHGGLFYLSLGLLHPQKQVRYKTVDLLERIAKHEAGKHFWDGLGRFAKLAFFRIRREMESNSGAWEAQLDKVIASNTEGKSIAAM